MSTDERSKPKMNMETPLSEFGETENEMAIVIQRNFRWFLWKKLLKQSSTEWRSSIESKTYNEFAKKYLFTPDNSKLRRVYHQMK